MKKTGIIKLEELNLTNFEELIDKKKGFLTYNDTSYFYKRCKKDLAYRELIAYEIATLFNIPSTFYQIIEIPAGRFEGTSGVLTLDYRSKNINFTKGYDILQDYFNEYLKKWSHNDRENNLTFNNLECILKALSYRYKFETKKKDIVNNLMEQIIKNIFLFDHFISNADRHFHNWEIVDNNINNTIYLNKNYDNEDMFLLDYKIPQLSINYSTKSYDWYDSLREFMIITENKYLNIITNMLNLLTEEALIKIIKITEIKHKIEIPLCTKQEIINKYSKHYIKLKQIIKEFEEKENKKIILHK